MVDGRSYDARLESLRPAEEAVLEIGPPHYASDKRCRFVIDRAPCERSVKLRRC